MRFSENKFFRISTYLPIQRAMNDNIRKKDLPKAIRWFYHADLHSLGKGKAWFRVMQKTRSILKRITN